MSYALISGCAPSTKETQRFFWPPGAKQPRIEYIAFYEKKEDAQRGKDTRVRDAILGKEKPVPLFDKPVDVASTGQGRFYVSDVSKAVVHVLDLVGYETRVLLDKEDRPFPFRMPHGVAVDETGRIYVTDLAEKQIYVFGPDEKLITALGAGSLESPAGIAVTGDGRRIFIAEPQQHRIAVLDAQGKVLAHWGQRGSGDGEYNYPLDVDLDMDGNLYVVDSLNARVQVLDAEGNHLRSFGERGTALGSFQIPKAVAVDSSGHVYVTDAMAHRFVIFDLQGRYLMTIGAKQSAANGVHPGGFLLPAGIDADVNDAIFIVDGLNRMIHQFQYLNPGYLAKHPVGRGQAVQAGAQ